ncbi:MAG TPA: hypothetical protein VKR06_39570 [Ktedonosporobacter sp.]|nr:hypothetical protein [Ktedonosporobacter sp.]
MRDPKAIDQMRIVYQLPHMEQVPVQKDIIYKSVDGQDLKLDVYYPTDIPPAFTHPTVIFVRGGSQREQVERLAHV